MKNNVVIIGAGQAGLTAATTLRDNGWDGGIHLISDERGAPYQRPPLSKGYLAGTEQIQDLALCTLEGLKNRDITLHTETQATDVDRQHQRVSLDNGSAVDYQWLLFATGSSPRVLELPGSDQEGIHVVRTLDDADVLRDCFINGGDTIFIGGGFLNLEVAIEAAKFGKVTVLEAAPQILGRVLSRPAAKALEDYHRSLGADIRCDARTQAITGAQGHVTGVELDNGDSIPAARVVIAIGAVARDQLAAEAGLETAGGIVVDSQLRTADERILAIGDCAVYPNKFADTVMRVESVQNATDQARHVAQLITDSAGDAYQAVPWFWSTQGERRLQIAGIALADDEARVISTDQSKGKLVVERLRREHVVAVETINAPGVHMKARRQLAETIPTLQHASI